MTIKYPIDISFKLFKIAEQVSVKSADGSELFYMKQKAFTLKEALQIYRNSSQQELLYTLKADRVLDFSPEYTLADPDGKALGSIKREGARSLWRASYHIDIAGQPVAHVHETNPWVKVVDGLIDLIPFVGFVFELISGYILHPKYAIDTPGGERLGVLEKRPSLFERSFKVQDHGLSSMDENAQTHMAVLLMVVTLLEGQSG